MSRFGIQDRNAEGQMAVDVTNKVIGDEGTHRSTKMCVNKVS